MDPRLVGKLIYHDLVGVEDGGKDIDTERYHRLVRKLIYLSHTRPDIALAVSVISRHMHAQTKSIWRRFTGYYNT